MTGRELSERSAEEESASRSRRPSFHTANVLIPESQVVVDFDSSQPADVVIRTLLARSISQAPVRVGGRVAGVISLASTLQKVLTENAEVFANWDALDLIRPVPFLDAETSLSEVYAHLTQHGVALVGHSRGLIGLITPTDMVTYLSEIASPYVLIQEIELAVRALIQACLTRDEIADAGRLVLQSKYKDREQDLPTALEDMDLSDEVEILKTSKYRQQLAPAIGSNPDSLRNYMKRIPEIRNALFHFKREPTPADLEDLSRARTWLFQRIERIEAANG